MVSSSGQNRAVYRLEAVQRSLGFAQNAALLVNLQQNVEEMY